MKLMWLVSLSLVALVSRLSEGQTCGPRLRKDWNALTEAEKTTYRGAIAAAMDSGEYAKFIEMHTEMMSEREAHRQCMFIYWHRYILTAFENMLRGQGGDFACVTVPYFNWITGSARFTAGSCSSFGDCLSIATELGGWTSGVTRTLSINGVSNTGRCVNLPPLDHFCQLTSSAPSACARCVPRSNWGTVRLPASTSYAAIRNQVLSGRNIGEMSSSVEQGCHNNIHANMGSTMGTFAAPADPLFWSHHAMVDNLHVIFHRCRVGTARMTFAQKAANPVAWQSCARRNSNVNFEPTDVVMIRTGLRGNNPIPASTDPVVGRYFAGLPNQYAGLMDTRDLGVHSYGYEISGQLASLFTQCDASPTSRRMEETNASTPHANCGAGPDYAALNNFPETDFNGQEDDHQDVVVIDNLGNPVSPDTPKDDYISDDSAKKVVSWYDQTLDAMGGDSPENMVDLERQACMFEHICLGGTQDFSPEFKELWKVKEPRCKTIVDAISNGSQTIQYEAWREDMELAFGCPEPTNDMSSNSGSDGSSQSSKCGFLHANNTIQLDEPEVNILG
ncbi:hypothetical protein CCR75_001259 [Bremia lactucae]|uniref:Tyrosinase copper-binding domain-containing protein n=1 Tax=Bremia lactucae TaxID=4779 RepID=A0A976IHW1_BRELC|nr:hypothetical protein CCR75_001259 [Bremia lactucae]